MSLFIGADLGTSALKLLLADEEGRILKSVSRSYSVEFPAAGWSQQDPSDWWEAFKDGIRELIFDFDPQEIKAIGFGGQMHGLVALDGEDQVIRPAILWNDGRTASETTYLNESIGKETLSRHTANIAFAGFTAPKLLWMREQEPENFKKIAKIMLPKDYMNYRLTGVHTTDFSDASGMLLLDVRNRCWSEVMLKICGLHESQMPKLFESFSPIGTLLPKVAAELGLSPQTIVAAGAGDNAAAAIGSGTIGAGKCNISLGTSGTIFISSASFSADPLNALHSFCHADGGWHLMGCILSAASCNKWFCEEILKTEDFAAEQKSITDEMLGKNDVFFLPYLMGERSPINDTDARGTFTGLRPDTARAEMLQAVLEGVAFAIRDNLEIAKAQGLRIERSGLCGGGARSPLWQKILANILNLPLDIPVAEEGPGYGAAMLAMVASGAYPKISECTEKFVKIRKTIAPDPALAARYEEKYQKFKAIYPAMKDVFKKIKE